MDDHVPPTNYLFPILLYLTILILLSWAHLCQDFFRMILASIPRARKPEVGQRPLPKSGLKRGKHLRNSNPHALEREKEKREKDNPKRREIFLKNNHSSLKFFLRYNSYYYRCSFNLKYNKYTGKKKSCVRKTPL